MKIVNTESATGVTIFRNINSDRDLQIGIFIQLLHLLTSWLEKPRDKTVSDMSHAVKSWSPSCSTPSLVAMAPLGSYGINPLGYEIVLLTILPVQPILNPSLNPSVLGTSSG